MLAACIYYLFALLWHENALIFVLLFPALCWVASFRSDTSRDYSAKPSYLLQCSGYLLGYVHWISPTSFIRIYDGTVTSYNLAGAVNAWTLQTFAALPGVELFINRAASYPTWDHSGRIA